MALQYIAFLLAVLHSTPARSQTPCSTTVRAYYLLANNVDSFSLGMAPAFQYLLAAEPTSLAIALAPATLNAVSEPVVHPADPGSAKIPQAVALTENL